MSAVDEPNAVLLEPPNIPIPALLSDCNNIIMISSIDSTTKSTVPIDINILIIHL
jgi:hypothetical protein